MLLRKDIPFKYIYGTIRNEGLLIIIYSAFIWLLYYNFHFTHISIPLSIPSILGTVIALLLGFRSNQAYDRWWEARHIWGAIVNDSRTLARQVIYFMDMDNRTDEMLAFQQRFVNRQIGWCFSLGQALRGLDPIENLKEYMDIEDIAYVSKHKNIPNAILELHGRDLNMALKKGWVNQFQQVEIDRTLSRLCDHMGKCERIKKTVFPSTYSSYIHFALLLFISLLPFGLIRYFGILMIPAVTAISACFLLIEKMAIHLQDPFENKPTDTAMTNIASNIAVNLKQMMKEDVDPYVNENGNFYLM